MGYNTTTGVISAPVSIADVQQALGVASNDLATLCSSSNVRMWSKSKPMNINKLFGITESDKEKINYGISNAPWVNTYGACKDYIGQSASSYYVYSRPLGGSTSPYRLEDFIGYDSTATAPIYASDKTSLSQGIYNGGKYVDVYINVRGANSHPNWLNLSYLDYRGADGSLITAAKNCYLGLVLKGANGTFQTIIPSPVSTLTAGDQIDMSARIENDNCYGTFTMMPFLINSDTLPEVQNENQIVNCLPLLIAQSNITIAQLVPNISIQSITYTRAAYGNGYKLTISSIVIKNTGIQGGITSIKLTFAGQNMTNVVDKNILSGTSIAIPSGTTTLTSNNFNDPTCYTTSTSGVYGSLIIRILNADTVLDSKTKSFSGSVPNGETF